jgi:hypothetical protein
LQYDERDESNSDTEEESDEVEMARLALLAANENELEV